MSNYLAVCEDAARAAGKLLVEWQDRIEPTEKAPQDLVTEADMASQRAIRERLLGAFPDHAFLGEEQLAEEEDASHAPHSQNRDAEYRWIVDPLDGTVNYVHRLQNFSVSIALEHRGEIVLGVVFDPIAEECFTAQRGEGAYLNGDRLSASACESVREALVAASFSTQVTPESVEVARFVAMLSAAQSVRRLGSAALNLAYLAAGRLDAYWATSVKIWDVAAGVLLVREAGGVVTGIDGGRLDLAQPRFLASANSRLHDEVLQVLQGARGRAAG